MSTLALLIITEIIVLTFPHSLLPFFTCTPPVLYYKYDYLLYSAVYALNYTT
ncbi:hypothetical protein CLOHYLEM_04202 [[Clostridium] hylemonae DSM 15053]|uniref:Uncharacterized protein n=1 Tax=[Clostridium] hylemonae DSM 15053 TaxID=553973 RepID=C0BWM0_9FIRM|nr:hypothetical protein CLOHYLEM_04202 [[Clostridium] hylemonae DSM 15053]